MNPELGEPEAGDITDAGLNETDEWRWTVGHLNVSNRPPGLGSNGERSTGARRREQSFVGAHRLLSNGTRKVKLIQE